MSETEQNLNREEPVVPIEEESAPGDQDAIRAQEEAAQNKKSFIRGSKTEGPAKRSALLDQPLRNQSKLELTDPKVARGQSTAIQNQDNNYATNFVDDKLFVNAVLVEEDPQVVMFETPQKLPNGSETYTAWYAFIQIFSELAIKIIVSALIIHMDSKNSLNFTPVILALFIYEIIKIVINFGFLFTSGQKGFQPRKLFISDIIFSLGYFLVFLGAFVYLKGQVTRTTLPLFVIPHIILTLVRVLHGECLYPPRMLMLLFGFAESLQILYISLKLSSPKTHFNWTFVLMFYFVAAFICLIAAYASVIFLVTFLVVLLFKPDLARSIPNLTIWVICSLLFYIFWAGVSVFHMLFGFYYTILAGNIGPNSARGAMNVDLVVSCWFMLIGASITIGLLLFIYIGYYKDIISHLKREKDNTVSVTIFTENLWEELKDVIANYVSKSGDKDGLFGRSNQSNDNHSDAPLVVDNNGERRTRNPRATVETQQALPEKESTAVCVRCEQKPSTTLVYPCGHRLVCQDCMSDYLKENDACPHCNEKIDQVYIVFFDNQSNELMAKGEIKFRGSQA